jgi:hypothetical protein
MLASTARSASERLAIPGPKYSTNWADDVVLAQELGDDQREIGGGHAQAQGARQPYARHHGRQQRDGLAEHRGFGLDAAHAPAEHAETVDHRRVRIGAHQRVGIGQQRAVGLRLRVDAVGEELEVDLVADADAGRHDAQLLERLLAPAQELVALVVAAELDLHVLEQGVEGRRAVDLHGMVHDEVHGHERLNQTGIAAAADDFRAQHGQIHDARHAGEVLEQDARGQVGDFLGAVRAGLPAGQGLDVAPLVGRVALVAHGGFQQDAHDVGQLRQRRAAQGFQRGQLVVGHGLAGMFKGLQGRKGFAHDAPINKISGENSAGPGRGQSQKATAGYRRSEKIATDGSRWRRSRSWISGRDASPRRPPSNPTARTARSTCAKASADKRAVPTYGCGQNLLVGLSCASTAGNRGLRRRQLNGPFFRDGQNGCQKTGNLTANGHKWTQMGAGNGLHPVFLLGY